MMTRWYPAHVKPVRKGWYEVHYAGTLHPQMRYFRGDVWMHCPESNPVSCVFGSSESDKWRGLTEAGFAEQLK